MNDLVPDRLPSDVPDGESTEFPNRKRKSKNRRSYWMRQFIAWHWISSAVSLVGMLMFAVTGITLNHGSEIESEPVSRFESLSLSSEQSDLVQALPLEGRQALPKELAFDLGRQLEIALHHREAEYSEDEIYLSMQSPGADAWLAIDRESGDVEFEETQRGWIAFFNDLHKGRHTGLVWKYFLDVFSIATIVFCLSGLLLLIMHAKRRAMTWPLVAFGLLGPFILIAVFMH
ncbi:PepSY-associated TM helix domain-containing protein [Stieleria sp. JC731]|uniref:PepSY-associated TM helix domain-containing protein n=1 Tax=Pirellulaceae TaxID=2691357 RepID=UPI001E600B26|nr:PepSY-associated TM helix domain-containing protein [Stieleria sp. JC731]MCC9600059.1 PepSY-associated TM helix domain-containing protein [Stieleria sp. JC731]